MPFPVTWIELAVLILSEANQKEKDKYQRQIPYMWTLKYGINEPIFRTERDSKI